MDSSLVSGTEPFTRKPNFDIVAIGASAGGIQALTEVISALPSYFPVSIVVVQHVAPYRPSLVPKIIKLRTKLAVKEAQEGETLVPSTVYFAPPDQHMRVRSGDILSISDSAKIQFSRPSVNPLFESVAAVYGKRAIGVVLTGAGSDGSAGVQAIKKADGRVLVQDKFTAQVNGMPDAAIRTGCIDFVLPLSKIAAALVTLVMLPGSPDVFRVSYPVPPYYSFA